MKEILKSTSITVGGTIVSLLCGAISTKILAVMIGPSGLGILSILRQIQQIGVTIATAGGQNALVQKIASTKDDAKRTRYIASIFWIMLSSTLMVALTLLIFAPTISSWAFGESVHVELIRLLIVSIVIAAILAFLLAVVNGFHAIGLLVTIQIIGSLVGVCIAYPVGLLASQGFLQSLILSNVVSSLTMCFVAIYAIIKQGYLAGIFGCIQKGIDAIAAQHFFSIAGTTLATGLIGTFTLLGLRMFISAEYGLIKAGLFDAAWTLSMMYVGFITSSFATYYLPKLSGLSDPLDKEKIMNQVMSITIFFAVPLIVSAITLKTILIPFFYSSEFLPALPMMRWMLIGDYFKVTSWVMGMFMLSHPDMKMFFAVELVWNVLFFMLSLVALRLSGSIEYTGLIFMLLYVVNFINNWWHVKIKHGIHLNGNVQCMFFIGILITGIASAATWNDVSVCYIKGVWLAFPCILFCLACFIKSEVFLIIKTKRYK